MKPAVDNISIAKIRKPPMLRALVETFFFTPQDIVYVESLCAGSNKRFWQIFELWKTLEKLQELLYEYLNTAFMGQFGT
jgi:hypothetical protein